MLKIHKLKMNVYFTLILVILIFSFPNEIATADDGNPLLNIVSVEFPETITEDRTIEFVVIIENQGNINISVGEIIEASLLLDYNSSPVAYIFTTEGISKNNQIFLNITWTPRIGDDKQHLLSIEIRYNEILQDAWDTLVILSEKRTDLQISNIDIPDFIALNETSTFHATILNDGKAAKNLSVKIKLSSSIEGLIDTIIKNGSLQRGEYYTFSFNWTPTIFGMHSISIKLSYNDVEHDSKVKLVGVGIHEFEWWNQNWHYRYFVSTDKTGILSKSLNFTNLLDNLEISGKEFENDTLRIVRYNSDGEVVEIVDKYWFNESKYFNSLNNSTGNFIWDAGDINGFKYYIIYFDISTNPGDRTVLNETIPLNFTDDGIISQNGIVDGWWPFINQPIEGSYTLIDDSIDINVSTNSIAENVTAFIFLNDNVTNNFTLFLSDNGFGLEWLYADFFFDEEGAWTIRIICRDSAGYESSSVERTVYVGRPDLEPFDIIFKSNFSQDRFFINDIVNISIGVKCYNASIENVNVFLNISNSTDSIIYSKISTFNFNKNENNFISFFWGTPISGEYSISISLDYDNKINESNETNNRISKILNIYEIPDLFVDNITLPKDSIYEYGNAKIDIRIKNKGLGDAVDYKVILYVESESQGYMGYEDDKDSEIISVEAGSSKKINLYWNNVIAGRWFVGVKIIFNETKKDVNAYNNRLLCSEILVVKSYERNKPVINYITIEPTDIEQGMPVTFTANITDDSGIERAYIIIDNPDGTNSSIEMYRKTGTINIYECTYENTLLIGAYYFNITAVDISYHNNENSKYGQFFVDTETQAPTISYLGAEPVVQLKDKSIEISCIAYDNVGIDHIEIVITYPSLDVLETDLSKETENRYVFKEKYNEYGEYSYYVRVVDQANNIKKSDSKSFWITSDLEDRDNDGMPDWWEQRYGLNPKDKSDADKDLDNDGISNIKEYKANINPEKDILLQNAGYRIKNNLGYLAVSIILFLMILFLFLYARRRFF